MPFAAVLLSLFATAASQQADVMNVPIQVGVPEAQTCLSSSLQVKFPNGSTWTPCAVAICIDGVAAALTCDDPPPRCILGTGFPGEPFPKCCPDFICAVGDQCLSEPLKRPVNDSDVVTEPGCVQATCDGGTGTLIREHCAPVNPKLGCFEATLYPDADHPRCCPKEFC